VVNPFVKTPPPGGMHRVYPGDKLFLLEVWTTPSIKKDLLMTAPVGGLVVRVQVKAGDWVQKDQELIRLSDPFRADPWPSSNGCSTP
jgi:biotin carboxyl carrier protein